jgi:hypothetical protein
MFLQIKQTETAFIKASEIGSAPLLSPPSISLMKVITSQNIAAWQESKKKLRGRN